MSTDCHYVTNICRLRLPTVKDTTKSSPPTTSHTFILCTTTKRNLRIPTFIVHRNSQEQICRPQPPIIVRYLRFYMQSSKIRLCRVQFNNTMSHIAPEHSDITRHLQQTEVWEGNSVMILFRWDFFIWSFNQLPHLCVKEFWQIYYQLPDRCMMLLLYFQIYHKWFSFWWYRLISTYLCFAMWFIKVVVDVADATSYDLTRYQLIIRSLYFIPTNEFACYQTNNARI